MDRMKIHVDFKRRQPKGPPDTLDIGRSVLVCNVFVFLFSAAKSSLFPFLPLYLRYLGFSASQTGLIIGGKTCSALIMAPLWARCAGKRNKRKLVLMFSILMLAAVYLSLTLIPTIKVDGRPLGGCEGPDSLNWTASKQTPPTSSIPSTSEQVSRMASSSTPSQKSTKAPDDEGNVPPNDSVLHTNSVSRVTSTTSLMPTTTTTQKVVENEGTSNPKELKLPEAVLKAAKKAVDRLGMSVSDLSKMTPKKIKLLLQTIPEGEQLYMIIKPLSPQEITLMFQLLSTELGNDRHKRDTTDTWTKFKSKVSYFTDKVLENILALRKQLFLTVLAILVIGEIFCSPVEKVADDSWYDFLDEVDDLEKYGRQRLLTSFAFIIFPILTTLLVDFTPCSLGSSLNHQSIHFYMFGGCLGLTFVVAMFYPVPTPGKRKYVSKVIKGCRVLCCNGRNFLFIITVFVMGVIYSTSNYLFWVVQDLGGKELPMGVAVAVAAFSEFPMLIFSDRLVKKLSHSGVITLAMAFLAVRQLYYSFLWTNWAVVPIEILHSVTHTAMWWAMLSNPDFAISTPVDRSIRSILSSLYFGVGYGAGSFMFGFVFEKFGHVILYRGAAILVASWMILFVIINRCIPTKTRIRYAKLLQAEDGNLSDSSNDFQEDWLEKALQDH
ncbi:major facilitator superfamily domain-containing protein 6-like protein B [Liolophura sinensis]|uniref:major facilitator superfamily domain-containing protein 6-like protein B n=1 Tax=Liolophura sinensis TaxID=3198878 RepID=UPI0031598315